MSPTKLIETRSLLRIAMLSIHSSPLGPLGTLNTGGMSVYVRELSKIIGNVGHQVDIFTYANGPAPIVALAPNVRLIHLSHGDESEITKEAMPTHFNRMFRALESFCRRHNLRYDLIHSHYWISGVVGAIAQARWRCPHLTMFHTLGAVKNTSHAKERESARRISHEHWLAKVADHIVVPALREKENLTRSYHASADKISTIPCGVNLDLFHPLGRAAARRRLGIDRRSDVVLYVGRFAPLKGIDCLLKAVAQLQTDLSDLHLVIIGGDGPEAIGTQQLVGLTDRLGIAARVTFGGRIEQNNLAPYYSAADLLAVPSYYESFGLVVLEALACGTPVVATPVGAVETILHEGVNGTIVAGSGAEDMARGIYRMLSKARHDRPDSRQIRDTVRDFTWSRIAAAVLHSYDTMLRSHEPDQMNVWMSAPAGFPN